MNAMSAGSNARTWQIVSDRLLEPRAPTPLIAPDKGDPIAWYRQIGDGLIKALRSTPPGTNVFCVTNQPTVGAWARRQASETSVHRWDAQNAFVMAEPIEHADDFIVEIFDHLLPGLIANFGAPSPTGTIGLASTDEKLAWRASPMPGGVGLERGHSIADVTLSGTTSDLFLALWNRPAAIDIVGDQDVLRQWRRAIAGN